ncbi:hypothetical protein M011DRAFT_518479 [Sporormia fimetaria CBS 119925]|uniref:Zn(2)-C6 fungal-type domain-containing protein n=1 Tax=Sporormia fimetaria CBS 119925 TaxID=1340428 RepID=A0A6A6VGE6_9PLEO|nr:hypothetical protein M011DRAFT_518479 [Sporormia fimetaria CBS 119925]
MASAYPGAPSRASGPVSPISSNNPATNPKMRKRTKTGCLTCRRRRIKCGEERPTCGNCIKSKRNCEGYTQRVIFKPPIQDWPSHPSAVSTMPYHSSMMPGSRAPEHSSPQSPEIQSPSFHHYHPGQFGYSNVGGAPVPAPEHLDASGAQAYNPEYHQPLQSPHHAPLHSPQSALPTPTSAAPYFPPQPLSAHAGYSASYAQDTPGIYESQRRYSQPTHYQHPTGSYVSQPDSRPVMAQHPQGPGYEHAESYTQQYSEHRSHLPRYEPDPRGMSNVDFSQGGHKFSICSDTPHDVTSNVKSLPRPLHTLKKERPRAVSDTEAQPPTQIALSGFGDIDGLDGASPTQILDEAAIEFEDDDYYDINSDEEMLDGPASADGSDTQKDFSLIRRVHHENTNDTEIRRFDTFIYEGILTQYRPELVANPLKNPKTARVFLHFIHVTGPMLSIYERNPRNSSLLDDGPVSPSHQSMWTYTIPQLALKNQSLLHAMLALASLHIARLQKASITPSWKHYAYSLKRLGRALANLKKRHSTSTLATSLLLAYYEIMMAEHTKWTTHVVGAAQLIVELDFRSLTQRARKLRIAQSAEEQLFPSQNPNMLIDLKQFDDLMERNNMMVNESLVSTIVGKRINYDDFGRVIEEESLHQDTDRTKTETFDLQEYEGLQDLYWCYCRQDMFASVVSGNPLSMDYRRWPDCPPRAPFGRIDALFGSQDHVILLLGRIADFLVRDRSRKIRQIEANGGHWRPAPGTPGIGPMGPPQQGGRGQTSPSQPRGPPAHMQGPPPGWRGPQPPGAPMGGGGDMPGPSSQRPPTGPPSTAGPGFYGMAPSSGPSSLPSSYTNPNATTPKPQSAPTNPPDDIPDLAAACQAALNEWNTIFHAHATVASLLSRNPDFAPLTADLHPSISTTPFGPALVYRSFDISVLWMLLHLAQILLLRSHPGMPPASMVAAAVGAPATQPYAILIGRIVAGLPLPSPRANTQLTPSLGGAHIESGICLFFAGVQYQDPKQREWLIERLLEVDRQTGWASAGVIARSCETAWERAAEAGRGPPYGPRRTNRFGDDRSAEKQPTNTEGDGSLATHRKADNWDENERRFVVRHRKGYLPWAMNLLADEEDLRVGMEAMGVSGRGKGTGDEEKRT